jgi:ABC-type transporter Mla subunit MlaD
MFIVIVWLVYLSFHKPDKTIIVKFKESPPIVQGLLSPKTNAYYRGIKIGEVSKVVLSEDQQYVLFYLNIYYKNLKLPENIKITLRIQDIFGGKYMELSYPKKPSPKFLCDKNTVEGVAIIERIDNYLITQLESGQMKEVLTNLNMLLLNLRNVSDDPKAQKDIQNILRQFSRVLDQISIITGDEKFKKQLMSSFTVIQSLNKKLPEINENIYLANTSTLKVNSTILNTDKTLQEVGNNIINLNQNLPNISEEVKQTSSVISSTNKNFAALNSKIPDISSEFIEKADQALDRANCLTEEMSNVFDKRFLIFRFMFGKPGKHFKECIPQEEQTSPMHFLE